MHSSIYAGVFARLNVVCICCSIPEYRFIVKQLPYSDYKVKQEIPVIEGSRFANLENVTKHSQRIVRKRFSTRIEFSQTGRIGEPENLIYAIHIIVHFMAHSFTNPFVDSFVLPLNPFTCSTQICAFSHLMFH